MSKIIKPLLNADGTQVKRKLVKGDWYYMESIDKYEEWVWEEVSSITTCIYYAEEWKPKQGEYYCFIRYWNNGEVTVSRYSPNVDSVDKLNAEIGNGFRTKEEAEQADIQQILDNLKEYYKNKEGK